MKCGRCGREIETPGMITMKEIDGEKIFYHYVCSAREEKKPRKQRRKKKESSDA